MLNVKIVYDKEADRELVKLIDTQLSFFVDFIDMNSIEGRKEGFALMNYWSAKKLPFVVVENEDTPDVLPKIFYSEIGSAINQLINYLNDSNKV